MPLFDFKCPECEETVKDVLLRINHDKAQYPNCPTHLTRMEKQLGVVKGIFHGAGFHCNDYHAPTRGF